VTRIVKNYITVLWQKSKQREQMSLSDRVVFLCLIVLEVFYRIGFWCVNTYKNRILCPYQCSCPVISIGNLSVGGTGKSVVVQFLAQQFKDKEPSIISRGYQSSTERLNQNLVIHNGKSMLCSVDQAGDECFMMAKKLEIPIAIGRNRYTSYQKLCLILSHHPGLIILDDAHQNHSLKKDLELLLLDARYPFENNHCLPAGPLREKNYSNADAIILTHADAITPEELNNIKTNLLKEFNQTHIFAGKHVTKNITPFFKNTDAEFTDKRFLAFAGIGSFQGFIQTIQQNNLVIGTTHEFEDHHNYDIDDIKFLLSEKQKSGCNALITTEKDVCKLAPLIESHALQNSFPLYIIAISFEFLTTQEYSFFITMINKTL
jgi:tetraacyldisaccharide 4'-kinase